MAPALGGFLIHGYGFAMIFIVSAGVGVLALLLSLLLPRDQNKDSNLKDDDDEITLRQFFLIFKEPRLLPTYAVIVVNMFMVGILFGFLPVYLHGIGYTPLQSGSAVSAATLSYLLVQPLAGYLADRISISVTVITGLTLAACAIILTTFTTGILLLAVIVVAGLGVAPSGQIVMRWSVRSRKRTSSARAWAQRNHSRNSATWLGHSWSG